MTQKDDQSRERRKTSKLETGSPTERLLRAYRWPVIVLFFCIFFNGPIRELMSKVDSLKFKDVMITIEKNRIAAPFPEVGAALARLTPLEARTLIEHGDNSGLGFCFDEGRDYFPAQRAAYQALEQAKLMRFEMAPPELIAKQNELMDKFNAQNGQKGQPLPTHCVRQGMIWMTDSGRAVRRYLLDLLWSYSFSPIK